MYPNLREHLAHTFHCAQAFDPERLPLPAGAGTCRPQHGAPSVLGSLGSGPVARAKSSCFSTPFSLVVLFLVFDVVFSSSTIMMGAATPLALGTAMI